ncbi:c-type cytochrome [Thioalkalivibrio sp.]|uniref:c-type cytochrome n=1 Tax=Thioalkalivibrio sp. TaxID=2093813 RepID=UPI0025F1A12C|nr:c-type cytochrome [Thioalkalivibrio sp.]
MKRTRLNAGRTRLLAKTILGALTLVAAPMALAAAPGSAESCLGCHGADGISSDPDTPTISGASDFFIENQLFLFQGEERPCVADLFAKVDDAPAADHCAIVADWSEDTIVEVAAHYAEQPFQSADQSWDAARAEAGAAIHEDSCARCHADAGSDPADDAGILAGQWKPYLVRTMTDFREGRRMQPATMEREMQALSDADIEALAAYYASQGQ